MSKILSYLKVVTWWDMLYYANISGLFFQFSQSTCLYWLVWI